MSKPSNQKSLGLLRTLEVPTYPWQAIGIDFVGPLPGSRNRHGEFDSICVIIDHLTSMVHLVPSRTTHKAKQVAEIIFDVVYKLHGLPERIISDRDSLSQVFFGKNFTGSWERSYDYHLLIIRKRTEPLNGPIGR